jgi:hypothetical protein
LLESSPPTRNPATHRLEYNWQYTNTGSFLKYRMFPEDGLKQNRNILELTMYFICDSSILISWNYKIF